MTLISSADEGRARLVELLRLVAAGERAAFRELYARTSAKLFGIALRILNDREDAEDVLQDIYLTVWNRAETFEPSRASPITWLSTIARNRAIDRRRQLGPRRPMDDLGAAEAVADEAPSAFDHLAAGEDGQRLQHCLKDLDERTRGAITSAFFGGRTYEELALAASVPLGTMKSVIRRGLIRLRGCLEA